VQFHNGATAEADVVVGADGVHSTVREAILGAESPRFSGNVAYRGLVPAMRVAHLGIEVEACPWWGPNHHFVHYFVGGGARYHNWVAVTKQRHIPGLDVAGTIIQRAVHRAVRFDYMHDKAVAAPGTGARLR
jgi:2-polyprenyl-6-methoxyphenol hydroxylase-like FAD-dependent oxidoreductase